MRESGLPECIALAAPHWACEGCGFYRSAEDNAAAAARAQGIVAGMAEKPPVLERIGRIEESDPARVQRKRLLQYYREYKQRRVKKGLEALPFEEWAEKRQERY
jgi:hypothetical protein